MTCRTIGVAKILVRFAKQHPVIPTNPGTQALRSHVLLATSGPQRLPRTLIRGSPGGRNDCRRCQPFSPSSGETDIVVGNGYKSLYSFIFSHDKTNWPQAQIPTANVPKENIPNEKTPTENIPTEKSPAEKTPAEKRPAESTPVLKSPADSHPDAAVPGGEALGKGGPARPMINNTINAPQMTK